MTVQNFLEKGLQRIFKEGQVSEINIFSYTFTDDGAGDDYDDTVTTTSTGAVVLFDIVANDLV